MNAESEDNSSIELAYASLALFADDGELDMEELNTLLDIALRDGVITDKENDVLRGVFNRLTEPDVTAEVWARIQDLRQQHSI
ncbi:MAG: hypothetical protein VCD00_09825 [Candidatus Hydrogenedentota bacterium]